MCARLNRGAYALLNRGAQARLNRGACAWRNAFSIRDCRRSL
jgi:hypothetical protein